MKTIDLGTVKREDTPIRAILYGEAGSGKTHLMRNMPKPLLLMDWDGKYEPLIGCAGIEVVTYYSADAAESAKNITKFWADWREAKKDAKWKTIVVDSLTALDRALERFTVVNSGKGKAPEDKATIQEYGDMKNWYKTFLNSICSVNDKNILVLAHEDFDHDEESGWVSIRPKVTGTIGEDLSSIFKDTWFLEVSGQPGSLKRTLYYQKYKKYVCASVTMSGAGKIEEPTFEKIMAERKK